MSAAVTTSQTFAASALPILKPLGLISSGILLGGTGAISIFTIPSLLSASSHPSTSPNPLLNQWRFLFTSCAKGFTCATLFTALTYGGVACLESQLGRRCPLPWIQSAILTLGIMPYTLIFQGKSIKKLMGVEGDMLKLPELVEEIRGWGKSNLVKGAFHLLALVVGVREVAKRGL